MLRVIIRRCGDDDGIHFLRSGNLLESIRSHKKLGRVQLGVAFGLLNSVEIIASFVQLVLKQIAQSHHARSAGIDHVGCIFGAASSASEQRNTHCGVRGRSAHQLRLEEQHPGGCCRCADEFPTVHFVESVSSLLCVC